MTNIRAALADVVRGLEERAIEPKLGNALVYALVSLVGVIQGSELEERLRRLERALEERTQGDGRRLAS